MEQIMKSTELPAPDFEAELQREIELYRTLAEKYEKKVRQRSILALTFCIASALGTLAILVCAILVNAGKMQIEWTLFFAYIGLALLCLLVGLLFFNGRHDCRDLAIECRALTKEKEALLQKKLEQKRAEEELARKAAIRVVEVLPKVPMSKTHKVANALRATSSILSAIYAIAIQVASIAALYKSKPPKKKKAKED